MAWVAVNGNGSEYIYEARPVKSIDWSQWSPRFCD